VLLRLRPSGLLDEFPKLAAYVARGEARSAYQRAFAPNGRSTPVIRKLADEVLHWVAVVAGLVEHVRRAEFLASSWRAVAEILSVYRPAGCLSRGYESGPPGDAAPDGSGGR